MEVFGLFGRSFACGLGAVLGLALGTVVVVGVASALQPPQDDLFRWLRENAEDLERWRRIGDPEPDPEPEAS